jgi:glycosyltransferase involved in cell wall biosynthesis
VVVSTYNRAPQLRAALDALLTQSGDIPYEVIVVDNNSTDDTSAVVASLADSAGGRLRYTFEPRQGLSHGRNSGIASCDAPLIALTDDDVCVARDWILQIRRTFDAHPTIDYIGGRVLPRWQAPPPEWLTTAHWAPLALQDYGPEPFVTGRDRAICLVGASLAFRRQVFDVVGPFSPALGRIKDGIGSTEDHDMQLRTWRAGMRGLYAPAVLSFADVTADRMVRAYHRRWHRGHGRHCAHMRLRELVPADLGPMSEPADIVTLFGSPAFVYADLPRNAYRWMMALCRRQDSFFYANQFRHVWNYIKTRYKTFMASETRSTSAEVRLFASAYFRKWRNRVMASALRA